MFFGIFDEWIGNVLVFKLVSFIGIQRVVYYYDIYLLMDFNGEFEIILFISLLKIIIKGCNLE